MFNLFVIILSIFNQINCINTNDEFTELLKVERIQIEPNLSQTHSIKYLQTTIFSFNIKSGDILRINIHGINCNFEIKHDGETLDHINLDTYSFQIKSAYKEISITPSYDIIEGELQENYKMKSCPLSINSFLVNNKNSKLELKNKEENIIYLNNSTNNILTLNYEIKEVFKDSFISLYFQFNEKSNISINVLYTNTNKQNNQKSKTLTETGNIFLDSEFLLYNDKNKTGGSLSINIINSDIRPITLHFKLIEKETISIIEKDALTFGFLTSKTENQYYYTEIFEGEEGELMLHNKRLYGELFAKIVDKFSITQEELYDTSLYPNTSSNEYNKHNLKLSYNYENTSACFDGCYLLITYKQKLSEGNFPLIGYEFTILYRSWSFSDLISNIIDIPYNEYIIGSFEKDSISYHYYSLSLPSDVENITIQLEGNYLNGFYGEGRKKIHNAKIPGKTGILNIISNKNVLSLNITKLNYKGKISFSFRSKDSYTDVYSFYYFRVLYTRKKEELIFPIDSQFGNLCIPRKDENNNKDKDKYYCNLIARNNYNGFAANFSISSSVPNQLFLIHVKEVDKNGSIYNQTKPFLFMHNITNINVDHYIFKFEFYNNEIKDIMACLSDSVIEIYPQIYSYQMFYLSNTSKLNKFNLTENYTLNYMYIHGKGGYFDVSFLNYAHFFASRNFKGRLIAFPIGNEPKTINFTSNYYNPLHIFCFQIIYNMKNKGIEEITSEGTLSQFVKGGRFPLYYYLKIKDANYANVDINLRLNSYDESVLKNNFTVKGYMLNEENIKRKLNGEYIQLNDAINGYYSNTFKVGLLQVNQEIKDNCNYLLIEIMNNAQIDINFYLLVDLVSKEYKQDVYFFPINHYLLETFDGKNNSIQKENKYYLSTLLRSTDQILIEFSSGYDDIDIEFNDPSNVEVEYKNVTGFKKYRVNNTTLDDIYFSIINKNNRNANYMIRYFYTNKKDEYTYKLNLDYERKNISLTVESASINLTFDSIYIILRGEDATPRDKVYFDIYGLLYKINESSSEYINTTSILMDQSPSYEARTRYVYNPNHTEKWSLIFENISRDNNYIYDLQLQINVIIEQNIFNEEFLIFTTKVDLTDIAKEKKQEGINIWIIIGPVIAFIALAIIVFLIIKNIRLKKSKDSLEEDIKTISYSSEVQRNLLIKEKNLAKKDKDYETTFI